jgi:hypothetical protein
LVARQLRADEELVRTVSNSGDADSRVNLIDGRHVFSLWSNSLTDEPSYKDVDWVHFDSPLGRKTFDKRNRRARAIK